MKKLSLLIAAILIGFSTFAQKNVSWEATVGANFPSYNVTGFKSILGFHVGARANIALPNWGDGVYTNIGALLTLKGAKLDLGDLGDSKGNMYYLEVPVHIGYRFQASENFSIFGEFGPYFAYGLFGKVTTKTISDKYYDDFVYEKEKHDTFDEYKRFDFGLGFRLGTEYKQKYSFSLGYDFGLINIWDDSYGDDEYGEPSIELVGSVKNKNFYISLGYKF